MKNWILVLAVLSLTKLNACGPFYPEGESVRFSLFNDFSFYSNLYQKYSYSQYYYNSNSLINSEQAYLFDENVNLWFQYLNEKVDKKSIYEGLYLSSKRNVNRKKSGNLFIRELNKSENSALLSYLNFAKKCENFNGIMYEYSWEKVETNSSKNATKAIKKALVLSQNIDNTFLKDRYAYLAIRMAYYNHEFARVQSIFENHFEKSTDKNAIYYWALHFKTLSRKNSPRNNVDVANVFCNSIEKRDACTQSFDKRISIEKMLYATTNDIEKANVYSYLTAIKSDFALKNLKKIYELNPNAEALPFLVEREINKIEDWILTPYYSNFNNSISDANYYSGYWMEEALFKVQDERVKKDRAYAEQLALWMQQTKFKSSSWKLLENYALFIAGKKDLTQNIKLIACENDNENRFKEMLLALDVVQSAEKPNLENEFVQNILMKEVKTGNNKFVFALARELEFKKNTTDAAYLFSKLNNNIDYYDGETNEVYWRPNGVQSSWFLNYYYDYFLYLNDAYSTDEMNDLISDIKNMNKQSSDFEQWKKQNLSKEIDRLFDLLGTKFIREDKLNNALNAFEKVNDTLWKSDNYPFKTYLNGNPFYTNFYQEHNKSAMDTIRYTKESITRKLIDLKSDFETNSGNKKAYAAFHIANCYFNMTQYGNSWMMRRYAWSQNFLESPLVDNFEFFECNLAKKYYLEAYSSATNKKFKALSLRMAGRCESYKMAFKTRNDFDLEQRNTPVNSYYFKLKNQFPEHYDELMSNCESFTPYYNSIN